MGNSRYSKYFNTDVVKDAEFAPKVSLNCGEIWDGLACKITHKTFTEPYTLEEKPHAHDFDQILLFLGSNSLNVGEFDAEVMLYVGEEKEKHIIDTTTVVHIPKGLIHCPLIFKRVGKPVVFMNIALTPKYGRTLGDMPPKEIKRY